MENTKELPRGWTKTKLADVCEILDHARKPINREEREQRIYGKKISELYPYYGATGQVGYIDDFLLNGEYILLGEDGAPFLEPFKSKAYFVKGKIWVNNHAHILKALFLNEYILHFLNQFNFKEFVTGTTRLKLNQSSMRDIPIPFPPIPEQYRIVAKIEELFSEIDKGIEALKKAQRQLKVYRQAVLNWAFEGKLTDGWRKQYNCGQKAEQNEESIYALMNTEAEMSEHTQTPKGWSWVNIEKVAKAVDPHPSHRTPPVCDNGVPYIGISECDYQTSMINFHIARKVSPKILEEHIGRYEISEGDFIIGKIGTIGKPFKIPIKRFYALSANVVLIKPEKTEIEPDFLFYLFQSNIIEKQFLKGSKATTQAAFGIQKVRLLKIPYCSRNEQLQVIQEIELRLSVCGKMEEAIEQSLVQAESLRQSILKKAFEGRLVPQDQNDEPSEKLLERISAERESQKPEKRTSRRRTK